jgi:urease accessory protein
LEHAPQLAGIGNTVGVGCVTHFPGQPGLKWIEQRMHLAGDVELQAAPQPVLVITHCPQHGTPFDLTRAAYHLGNRHVPIELKPDHLKIEPDHVLADMLRAMHLIVNEAEAAFEPEGGAYSAQPGHGHAHGGHGHDHHDHDGHAHHDH